MAEGFNIGEWDQAATALRNFIALAAKYREGLLQEGFSREEAILLIVALQTSILTGGKGKLA